MVPIMTPAITPSLLVSSERERKKKETTDENNKSVRSDTSLLLYCGQGLCGVRLLIKDLRHFADYN